MFYVVRGNLLTMMAFLNDYTFTEADWRDVIKIREFLALCAALGIGQVSVFTDCLPQVSQALKNRCFSMDVRNRMRALFTRPYVNTCLQGPTFAIRRYNANNYSVSLAKGGGYLPGNRFAWSYLNGGMLLGLSGGRYGDSFKYAVDECNKANGSLRARFEAYMASQTAHRDKPIMKRWLYAYKAVANIECAQDHSLVRFPPDHVKHFSPRGVDWTVCLDSTKRCGRDRTQGAAKFIPEIRKDSLAYAYLVAAMIRIAFANQAYDESGQDAFAVDVGLVIGAADGKPTSVLVMYVTNGCDVHVRPYENAPRVAAYEIGAKLKQYL